MISISTIFTTVKHNDKSNYYYVEGESIPNQILQK
jgi:hypothetical protein